MGIFGMLDSSMPNITPISVGMGFGAKKLKINYFFTKFLNKNASHRLILCTIFYEIFTDSTELCAGLC